MQYATCVSRFDGREWASRADKHIYALEQLGLPVGRTIASLECGNMPKCVKEAIRYGIENNLEFHMDNSPFRDIVWDMLSDGLKIGYEDIRKPICIVAKSDFELPKEPIDATDMDVYRHLQLDKSFNEIKKAIPNLNEHTGVSINSNPVSAIASLLIYAAKVQNNSGIKFCKNAR